MHAAGAVELRNALASRWGVDLPATLVFDHPTVSAIAAFIAAQLPGAAGDVRLDTVHAGMQAMPPHGADGSSMPLITELVSVSGRYPTWDNWSGGDDRMPSHVSGTTDSILWTGMQRSADTQRLIPPSRWDMDALYSPDPSPGVSIYARFAAIVDRACDFDAAAFRLTTTESAALDPQIRYSGIPRVSWRRVCCHLHEGVTICSARLDPVCDADAGCCWRRPPLLYPRSSMVCMGCSLQADVSQLPCTSAACTTSTLASWAAPAATYHLRRSSAMARHTWSAESAMRLDFQARRTRRRTAKSLSPHANTACLLTFTCLGLAGPCASVDTACSSSLVATHMAQRVLLSMQCDAAMIGGTNLMIDPLTTAGICQLQVGGGLQSPLVWILVW